MILLKHLLRQSLKPALLWIGVFLLPLIDDEFRFGAFGLGYALFGFSFAGIMLGQSGGLTFLRLHSRSILDFYKILITHNTAIYVANCLIAVLYCCIYNPKTLGWVLHHSIDFAWVSLAYLLAVTQALSQRTTAQRTTGFWRPFFQTLAMILWVMAIAAVYVVSTAASILLFTLTFWTATMWSSPLILQGLHTPLRKRIWRNGFAAVIILMAVSVAIAPKSFLKTPQLSRKPASMGERDRY